MGDTNAPNQALNDDLSYLAASDIESLSVSRLVRRSITRS